MEENLNFVLKLSLEEMALRNVVVNLWNENDIISMIQNFEIHSFQYGSECHVRDRERWQENIEEKVKDKVPKLTLPESLKKRMMPVVRLIGHQILSWRMFHEYFDAPLKERPCWSSYGVIDLKNAAQKIVGLEALNIINRYRLACLYCLEDLIRIIWEKLSEECKKIFCAKSDRLFNMGNINLLIYWSLILKAGDSALELAASNERLNYSSFNQRAFLSSALLGNKAATEYFFRKLKSEERDSSLHRVSGLIIQNRIGPNISFSYIPSENFSDVLFYLMNQMLPQERIHILKKNPGCVLNCLLDWPWQDILLDTADFIWTFLPKSECHTVMSNICNSIRNTAFNFPSLFQEFFLRSPRYFRKEFVRFLNYFEFSSDALTETIQLILRDADVGERAELVSSFGFLTHLKVLIAKDEWQTVETYLREAKLPKENIDNVKQVFGEFFEFSEDEEYSEEDKFTEEDELSQEGKFFKEDKFFKFQKFENLFVRKRKTTRERLFRLLYETASNSKQML